MENLYYVLTDHLGSWNKVMDENKNIVQQTHFDPWGNRMTYTDWALPQTQTDFAFDRGFTGHEHYDRIHVINANARLYDPVIGRFFSPDPFVQAPSFTQAFNRYSYCMNNPVMYSDPDGEWLHIVIGAVIGGVSNLIGNWSNCDGFWQYAAAFGAGAASGAVSVALPGWGSLIGGSITGATNSVIAQTGNNFTSTGAFNWSRMSRVSMVQKQLKNETIDNVWPKDLDAYISKRARIINPDAMDFNAQWIEYIKEQNAYIYDIGTPNGSPVSSPYYNMEQARTMDYLNLIKVNGIDGKIIWYGNGN